LGYQDLAKDLAVYGFYALVTGVALKTASYVRYGEGKLEDRERPQAVEVAVPPKSRANLRLVGLIVLGVVLGGIALVSVYQPGTIPFFPRNYGTLSASSGPYSPINEPDGSKIALLAVSAFGGALPYNFTARWSDGVNQTNTTGVFQRNFASGQSIPDSAIVTVKSSDGQFARVNITAASK
jgi:hypothetical protein